VAPGDVLGVKLVTVFPANTSIPTVQALYVLFDGRDGAPLAHRRHRAHLPEDGVRLGPRLRFLSRADSRVLLMVGAGGLATHLVAAHRAVSPTIERVLIWNRSRDRAASVASALGAEVADDIGAAVEEADIVCTATMTKEALVEGRWLRPGTHLDLVGAYLPDHREVDDEAVVRAELYVDTREVTTEEDGDLVIPLAAGLITLDDIRGDLFQLCRGEVEGRTDPSAITLFENGGGGHLDLMTADLLWRRAGLR
jgi:ornithine cyclodeaminase